MAKEPLSMREGAVAYHEMFLSFQEAGFSKDQSFQMILAMISSGKA